MNVYIKPECHAEIMFHVNKSQVEVSGLGRIEKTSCGSLVVTKVYLLDQENSAVVTDINADKVAELMYTSREDTGDLNFWWHSHVNMDTYWSQTDMDTIKQFGKNGYLLSTVFNKKGSHRTSYFQGATDFLPSLFMDELDTSFEYLPTSELVAAWDKEHDDKCKPMKVTKPKGKKKGKSNNFGFPSASGIGEDASIPTAFADDEYWVEYHGEEGEFSGYTMKQIGEIIATQWTATKALEDYDWLDQYAWWDIYAKFKGFDPSDEAYVAKLVIECQDLGYLLNVLDLVGIPLEEEEQDDERIKEVRPNTNTKQGGNRQGTGAKGSKGNRAVPKAKAKSNRGNARAKNGRKVS